MRHLLRQLEEAAGPTLTPDDVTNLEAAWAAARKRARGALGAVEKAAARAKKYGASGEEVDSEMITELLRAMNDASELLERIRDHVLYAQGLYPFELTGKRTKDPEARRVVSSTGTRGFDPDVDKVVNVKNFPARILYRMGDAISNMGQEMRRIQRIMTKQEPDQETPNWWSFWDMQAFGMRKVLNSADTAMQKDVFPILRAVAEVVLPKLRDVVGPDNPLRPFGKTTETEASVGDVKVILDTLWLSDPVAIRDQEVGTPRAMRNALSVCQEARARIEHSGYGHLWYGEIWVTGEGHGKRQINPNERKTLSVRKGSRTWTAGASYQRGADNVVIYDESISAIGIIHEMGHRQWYKFMTSGQRSEWEERWTQLPSVSKYAGRNAREKFAETFQDYVLGKPMPDALREYLRSLLGARRLGKRTESMQELLKSLVEDRDAAD